MPKDLIKAFRELAQFVAKQADKVITVIKEKTVDLSGVEGKIGDVSKEINKNTTTLKKELKEISTTSQDLIDAISVKEDNPDVLNAMRDLTGVLESKDIVVNTPDNTKGFKSVVKELEAQTKEIKKPIKSDTKLHTLLKNLKLAVEKIHLEEKDIDLSELKNISASIEKLRKELTKEKNEKLETGIKAVEKAIGKLKLTIPKTFKLEETQMRQLRQSGGGSNGPVMLQNQTNTLINPATEDKQDAIIAALGGGTDQALIILEDSGDPDISYLGNAAISTVTSAASWKIQRLDSSSGLVITWADGDDSFNNIWDNRESLSYS